MPRRQYGSSSTETETKKKQNKTFGLILAVATVCFAGACFFGYKAYSENKRNSDALKLYDNIRDIAYDNDSDTPSYHLTNDDVRDDDGSESERANIVTDEALDENMLKRPDVQALMDINPDVVAWVYVPNTGIDYPVMQEPEWGKYQYLYSDIYKKYCVSGSLFIPAKPKDTDIKLDAHIIIYGHNMKNGSMFSTLSYYKEEDFYKSSPYVYVYYPDRTERWAIWAVAHISSQSGSYEDPVALGSDEYKAALEEFDSLRYYDTNVSGVTAYTRTLTLSTCDWTYTNHDGRITVTSVLDKTLIWDD